MQPFFFKNRMSSAYVIPFTSSILYIRIHTSARANSFCTCLVAPRALRGRRGRGWLASCDRWRSAFPPPPAGRAAHARAGGLGCGRFLAARGERMHSLSTIPHCAARAMMKIIASRSTLLFIFYRDANRHHALSWDLHRNKSSTTVTTHFKMVRLLIV